MPMFSSQVKGPDVRELRATFNNVCAIITQDDRYKEGLDPESVSTMLNNIYYYVTGDRNRRITLPAPISDPSDRHRVMWPEGARINSRAPSTTSSRHSKVPTLSTSYSQKDADRASSVVSSSIASKHRYIRMAGDSDEEDTEAESASKKYSEQIRNSRQSSASHARSTTSTSPEGYTRHRPRHKRPERSNTVRIASEPLQHSQSIEAIRAARTDEVEHDDIDDEGSVPPLNTRPPASRRVYNGPTIAED